VKHDLLSHAREQLVDGFVDKGVEIFLRALPGVYLYDVVASTRPTLSYHSICVMDRFVENLELQRLTCYFL